MHIRLKTLLLLVSPLLLLVATAYVQWGTVGIPALPPNRVFTPETAVEPYGFPAWLRITHYVENQLGFKMVKWIQAIEFVESVASIYKGEGGYAEDKEYFGELANI